jgi:meso-butanediol dehydrogenase/(S,S)-butanediol dehydrogenase/diacetyl reductase
MGRFDGRVALVTGAASGIGRATAVRLGSEGARVCVADVQEDGLAETARLVAAAGADALVQRCDVSDPASVRATVEATVTRFGGLDVLCNIAGILRFDNTHDLAVDDWNRVLAVNLTGTFLVCQAAIPHLLARKGTIVNLASTAALSGHPWTAAYSASKGGVLALTSSLAVEYGKQGVRVNAVCPGSIKTPMRHVFSVPEGANPKLVERIMPFTGFAEPEAVAATIAFLASDEAHHIYGTALRVDGGALM